MAEHMPIDAADAEGPALASVLAGSRDLQIACITIAQGPDALARILSEIRHLSPQVREWVVQQLYGEMKSIQFSSIETGTEHCLRQLLAQTMGPLNIQRRFGEPDSKLGIWVGYRRHGPIWRSRAPSSSTPHHLALS
jgi:hypothetical protein